MKANPPQPPFKKGGDYLGFLADVFHRLLLKKSGAFSPPFLKGGGGDLLFIAHPNAQQKTAPASATTTVFSLNQSVLDALG
jgi:hypothetical protein